MHLSNKFILTLIILSFSIILKAQDNEAKKDSTMSGYVSPIDAAPATNPSVQLELQNKKADYYRLNTKISTPWFALKKQLNKSAGIQFNLTYTSAFIGASSVIAEGNQQTAASGILDIIISWNVINRKKGKNQGSFIFYLDDRHIYYGDIPIKNLNFETGSATITALKFNKSKFRMLELYYQQKLFNDRVGIIVGKIDMPDWFTYHSLLHPMLHFTDYSFSVSPTLSWSNAGLGVLVGGWFDKEKRFGMRVGFNDVAGDNLDKPNFFDLGASNWKNRKFLKMGEFAFTPKASQFYSTRFTLTYWHADQLTAEENSFLVTEASQGIALQASGMIKAKHSISSTIGITDGKGANTLAKVNIAAMYGLNLKSHDLLGLGLAYTESSISNRGQFLSEVFYRFTLSKTVSITPTVKGIINPSLDPSRNFLAYYGVRSRITL